MPLIAQYISKIRSALAAGNATEHTYRAALQSLVEGLKSGITATNEPKRHACGAPDFVITARRVPIGYIETKNVDEILDKVEKTDQLRRYRESLGNLILTDYLEFRWYVGGEHRLTARLGRVDSHGKLKEDKEGIEKVRELLSEFLVTQTPTVGSPKELAQRMAHLARLIRDVTTKALTDEDKTGSLHDQMDGFRKTLLHDLKEEQFADMYAQTICYGLFAARCNTKDGANFTREHAAYDLPKTNPFLRKMFQEIAGYSLDDRIAWAVDDVANLLAHADMEAILTGFGKRTRLEDPVVHFYETFLAAYDPKLRETRGVYYTPEPVVSYIVRSVDHILKKDFGLSDGLADSSKVTVKTKDGEKQVHKVQILDPATGTGTFLHGVVDLIHESFMGKQGMWSSYVHEHLLPRVFGFELLMAPYAVTHMKLGLQLAQSGYDFAGEERLGVYLTNTLEEAEKFAGVNLFAQWVVEEANEASRVKMDAPVMVVLGNPPYSGHSVNRSWYINENKKKTATFIGKLIQDYYYVDGKPLGEKNPKWLQDDYVKFIRFAQWRIERTGHGVLAFITNHGYLDNPTFRGMRKSLMDTFDDIWLLDLHGNSKKKEKAPDGSPDKNVFDIQQGVAIGIFVKRDEGSPDQCKVRHAELWGDRAGKYKWLSEKAVADTQWTEISPSKPYYFFVPRDDTLRVEYEEYWNLTHALPVNNVGVVTGQDARTIAFSAEEATVLANNHRLPRSVIKDILYRPFDTRCITYDKSVVTRNRQDVMRHMFFGRNIGLVFMRQVALSECYTHFLATSVLVDNRAFYSNKGIMSIAPLYLYPSIQFDTEKPTDAPGGRRPNLAPEFIKEFSEKLGLDFVSDGKGDRVSTFGPEDIFAYMYAVFHSPTYRKRYAEFLKIDFPRLPLTSSADLFRELCALGDELVSLHLMDATGANLPGYPESGSDIVEEVRYEPEVAPSPQPSPPGEGAGGRVWINKAQFFDGVPPEVWEFHIGGYQVCQKWLKDRKGRTLGHDDLEHYRRTAAALGDTIRLMGLIDESILGHGGFPIV
ncbi:MAG: N-6 DNA methylase [Armatimonadetes bacterium]|nr:N-6 DNA methylase [Armatimonadota bacterium]